MFNYVKKLQFYGSISKPNPRSARLLSEQFGGLNAI